MVVMNNELKNIKKLYGEKMMQLCRELFATIIDNHPGMLEEILKDTFAVNKFLCDDIICNEMVSEFKDYIYGIYDRKCVIVEDVISDVLDPKTLMRQAGYTLYECKSEEDIQKFREFYSKGEELCTFKNGSRLTRCYVYFAVKDGAEKLKRSDFLNPKRQDEYGTSVISIQFTRDDSHTLSIKNRYNHTVNNPDATYSNNLDNIVSGLTQSFADYYGMIQSVYNNKSFELPGYVRANDGKFYKYNYEISNVYYCPGNIIIDNFEVKMYPREKYLIMDYFIIDLVNKTILNIRHDSFIEMLLDIKNVEIINDKGKKNVNFYLNSGELVVVTLDKMNRIIGVVNNHIKQIGDNFLWHNKILKEISFSNVLEIGDNFLFNNEVMTSLKLANVKKIGSGFMCRSVITDLEIPEVLVIEDRFMSSNHRIRQIRMPKVQIIGNDFLKHNRELEEISLENVQIIGREFLSENICLKEINLPEVLEIADDFCYNNLIIGNLKMPKVKKIGNMFMYYNYMLEELILPNVEEIGYNFMCCNTKLVSVDLPKLERADDDIFKSNNVIKRFNAPKLKNKKEIKNKLVRRLVYKRGICNWF